MASTESQQFTLLKDEFYDDPEQLSQLLRQRAGRSNSLHWTTSTDPQHDSSDSKPAVAAEDGAHLVVPPLHAPNVPSVRDFAPRRAPNDTSYVKPSLSKYHSAPTGTGIVMDKESGAKMVRSFNDVLDRPGDTQPDSQIYKQWTSGLLGVGGNGDNGNVTASLLHPVEEEEDAETPTDGADVVGSSQEQQHSPTVTSPTVVHDDDLESRLRVNEPLTSPLKFETPAMGGRKRDSQGQILSSAMRTVTTPGTALTASAFFPIGPESRGVGQAMSLTQAFNATQARTSPIVGAPSEDAVFQRPSPNFNNARNSSPVPAMSSPIKAVRSETPLRSSSEPRAEYVTMRQSQERRSRDFDNEATEAAAQDSWDEPSSIQKQIIKRKAREKLEREAGKSFAKVTAPTLVSPPPHRRKRKLLSMSEAPAFQPFQAPTVSNRSAYGRSDQDDSPDAESADELSEPIQISKVDEESPDELSQGIPSSARPTPVKHKAENKIQVPNTSSHPQRTFSSRTIRNSPPASPSAQLHRESQVPSSGSQPLRRGIRFKNNKDFVTIMDSQPDSDSIARPKSLLPSSPSTNQYSINQTTLGGTMGYTSQIVSSSMPPMPPRSSSQLLGDTREAGDAAEDDEERVPSSPPALNDDDVVYDEHDYDNHHSPREVSGESQREESDDQDDGVPESEYIDNAEAEMDMVKPRKSQEATSDPEVPETAQLHEPEVMNTEEEDLVRSSHPEDAEIAAPQKHAIQRRVQRRATVPDSDMMEDTQPSDLAQTDSTGNKSIRDIPLPDSAPSNSAAPNHTNSTEPFHTAPENRADSQSDINMNQKQEESTNVRSLVDIANQIGTQKSGDIDDIEIPQLSFAEDIEDPTDAIMSGSSPVRRATKKRKITYSAKKKALMSPFKESDSDVRLPVSSPLKQIQQVLEDTPPSTMEREEQGALAAARAREEVAYTRSSIRETSISSSKLAKAKPVKRGALKPVNKALLTKTPPKPKKRRGSTFEKSPSPSAPVAEVIDEDVGMGDPEPSIQDQEEQPNEAVGAIENASNRGEAPTGDLLVPNRIFASWPGQGFHPATCLNRVTTGHLEVRYDDGTRHVLEPVHVRALDLRIGDQVKVNKTGMKKHTYVVVGLADKIDVNHDVDYPMTDSHGYASVILEVKQRDSLPKAKPKQSQQAISVPVTDVYLTQQLWVKYRNRLYTYAGRSSLSASASRLATPTSAAIGPVTPTKSRRGTAGPSLLKETFRAGSVTSSMRDGNGTVFANMAFAVTLGKDYNEKDIITDMIASNGGTVFEGGFQELFEGVDALDNLTSPSSKGKGKSRGFWDEELLLKEEYEELHFIALITDSHSRRTKYVQALALNIPCVHHRWLTDSVAASRALPFGRYLLPAGLSTYLDPLGIVRSRQMDLYDPDEEDTRFKQILKGRELLLLDQNVLLVTGTTKKELERKKPYLFLAQALGPSAVGHCEDIDAAKDSIKNGKWDYIFVDGGAEAVTEVSTILFENTKSSGSKTIGKNRKRKRDDSEETDSLIRTGMVCGKKVHLACDEFIVQSLILGALIEQ